MFSKNSILFAGGGSGGHLLPGIALAEELQRRLPSWNFFFVVTAKNIDKLIMNNSKFSWAVSPIVPFPQVKTLSNICSFTKKFIYSWWQSEKFIRRIRPKLLIGLGGYGCFPLAVLGKLHNIPIIYLESNIQAGKVVRWLSPWSEAVFCHAKCIGILPHKIINLGIPLRRQITNIQKDKKNTKFTILVMGGSQGASVINNAIFDSLPHILNGVYFIHIIGKKTCAKKTKLFYEKNNIPSQIYNFHEKIEELYRKADLIISRAGGSTIAEITAIGIPSILIPFAKSSENHQQKNAEHLAKQGAAIVLPEKEISALKMSEKINLYVKNEKLRCQIQNAAQKIGKPHATQSIAHHIKNHILGKTS